MKSLLLFLSLLITATAFPQKDFKWKTARSAGYEYKYVNNDPMRARFYTLKNGLTVMLSVNHQEPRIAYRMAVRAGSNNDPRDHTGLAHYLEHLLFKGTGKYGSLDWSKEKPYLDQISALYEKYNQTTDTFARSRIYHEIDSVSGIASKYAIANEYSKLMTEIGSHGTNAHTWVEETVYEEEIPANAIDKFLTVQAERFRDPQFRLFHTELEAVYEEKNRTLDSDPGKMWNTLLYNLFPTHNYGQQSTIGTIEHLKNPSLLAIRDFYNTYYVPDNMAIIFSGDFNADSLIGKIEQSFSFMQPKPVDVYDPPTEVPIDHIITKEVLGPSAENIMLGFRTPAAGTRDALVLDLITSVLFNGKAGLLDLNLNQQQKVQSSEAELLQFRDYGVMIFEGKPKQGQSLEDVKNLLIQQIEQLQKGDFDELLLKAITANSKLNQLLAIEENGNRVNMLLDAFIKSRGERWDYQVSALDEQDRIKKEEIIRIAKKWIGLNNYVLLYKRKGEDNSIVKVVKPSITAVETNAGKQSDFVKRISAMPLTAVQPTWLDFNKQMDKSTIGIAEVLYVPNTDNELFTLSYRFEMGAFNNLMLPIASEYLSFVGTSHYSSEEITKKFYSLACTYAIQVDNEVTTISLTGLQRNFSAASALLEELLSHCKPDEATLTALKERIAKGRLNAKTDKSNILRGMRSYAIYGSKNPFNTELSNEAIEKLQATELTDLLHHLTQYRHRILYYGPIPLMRLKSTLEKIHILPKTFTEFPAKIQFNYVKTEPQVLFSEYDMIQTEIWWVNHGGSYNPSNEALIRVFNGYFGSGMNSIVFQTIRESMALAYATFANYVIPEKKTDDYITLAYVGCQADKMYEAISGMNTLLDQMPVSDQRFTIAKSKLKSDIETERVTKNDIITAYLIGQQKGVSGDIRKQEYAALNSMTIQDIDRFHAERISGKPYTYCVIGSEKKIDKEALKQFGEIKTLSLEEIFGY